MNRRGFLRTALSAVVAFVAPSPPPAPIQRIEPVAWTALHDFAAIDRLIMDSFAQALAWQIDHAILNGTGIHQPLGVLNARS